jgi:colicin import membrane protein
MRATIYLLAGALVLVAQHAPALAQNIGQDPVGAPRVPQSHSVEQADATLAQVARDRAKVNEEFAASERVCYTKFFVNSCLDDAKEKRRAALSQLRAVEVEASHYKRQDSVDRRDAELAERVRKDAQEQALRAQQEPKAAKVADDTPRAAPGGPSVAERQAQYDAKVQRRQAEDAASAGKRAANVAAFEKKRADSLKRQAAIGKKKQEAEQKRAAKAEAEKKKAAAAAASASAKQ